VTRLSIQDQPPGIFVDMRVLVVEDELRMAALLKQGLEEHDHSVTVVHDGQEALELASSHAFDIVVLDVMLPGLDGFEVARRLRRNHQQVPILMLTARDSVPDIARGLDGGADDYLTKPFAFAELLARIRALGRRPPAILPPQLSVGDLVLDPGSRRVKRRDQEIRLTATEYRLLEFMMRRSGQVLPRGAIVEAVWGFNEDIEENTLEAFVSALRNKIDRNFSHKLIHTIRGVGYCVREHTPR
jgi:two-component system OmpR family response regulator